MPTNSNTIRLDEAMIENLVRTFYTKVRADAVLGPIFEGEIGDNWEPHLHTLIDFWSSMMLKTGRYNGRPMPQHMKLKQVRPAHFDIWLGLFRDTAMDVAGEVYGPMFIMRAERVAENFKRNMFFDPADLDPSKRVGASE